MEEIAAGVHQDRRRVAAETVAAKEVACVKAKRNAELGREGFFEDDAAWQVLAQVKTEHFATEVVQREVVAEVFVRVRGDGTAGVDRRANGGSTSRTKLKLRNVKLW